jgi:transposase
MERVIIGVDPHKLSATIEVIDADENLLGAGRFTTDKAGFAAMRKYVASWRERTWAVEGSLGVGRPLAQRLLELGEHVVDVPAKLAARVRIFDTGHNRKTDARDAHSIAVVAARTKNLASSPPTASSRRCGCWSTVETSCPGSGFRPSTGSNACCPS